MKTAITFTLFALLVAGALCVLPSCHSLKTVAVTTRDSVVLKVKDTTVVKFVTVRKDSTVVHDTTIGISGGHSAVTLPKGSKADTTVRTGNTTLRRHIDDKGDEHIDCNSDSLTIVVADLIIRNTYLARENDTLSFKITDSERSHTAEIVKEKQLSWFGRLWANVEKYFAWFGLICFVYMVYKIIRKFT